MRLVIKIGATLNALYTFVAMYILLLHFDPHRGQNPWTATMSPMDVALGAAVLLPVSIALTFGVFLFWKAERNIVNVATVYSAIFGTLTAFYFLWTLKY